MNKKRGWEKSVGEKMLGKCFAIYLQRSVIFYNCLAQDLDICLEKYIQASMIFSRFIADLDITSNHNIYSVIDPKNRTAEHLFNHGARAW